MTSHRASNWIWGVTVDNVTDSAAVVESLAHLRVRPTARIVFDPGASPDDYRKQVHEIHQVAAVMGSPVDSAPPSGRMTVDAYRRRMSAFMDGIGPDADFWEIGNEVNGDWTGDSAAMGLKIDAAQEEATARKLPTALTLFYSDFYKGTDREMATWAAKYLSDRVRKSVGYVLVSFYPDTATGSHPDWKVEFGKLAAVFPTAKFGFGELGLRKADFSLSDDVAGKKALIERYYRMRSPLPGRYIGGYFWWTFRQDACMDGNPFLQVFRDVMR